MVEVALFLDALDAKYGARAKRGGAYTASYLKMSNLAMGQKLSYQQHQYLLCALFQVGSTAQKKGYDGPVIGAKMSERNVRNFDADTMKAGQNIIGLQVFAS